MFQALYMDYNSLKIVYVLYFEAINGTIQGD